MQGPAATSRWRLRQRLGLYGAFVFLSRTSCRLGDPRPSDPEERMHGPGDRVTRPGCPAALPRATGTVAAPDMTKVVSRIAIRSQVWTPADLTMVRSAAPDSGGRSPCPA